MMFSILVKLFSPKIILAGRNPENCSERTKFLSETNENFILEFRNIIFIVLDGKKIIL